LKSIIIGEFGGTGLTIWSWREGVVDVAGEHIELRYGDADKIPLMKG
jgi:hypothetical protein